MARLNYAAADYAGLLPLLEPLDSKVVVAVLKETARKRQGPGRGGAGAGRKRGRDGGSTGAQAGASVPMKRKGASEMPPLA